MMDKKPRAPKEEKGKKGWRTVLAGATLLAVGSFPNDGPKAGEVLHDPTNPSDNPPTVPQESGVPPLYNSQEPSARSAVGTTAPENSAEQPAARQIGTLIGVTAEYLANHRLEYVLNKGKLSLNAVDQNLLPNQDVSYFIPVPTVLITNLDIQRRGLRSGSTIRVGAPKTTTASTTVPQDGTSKPITGSSDQPLVGNVTARIDFGPKNGETYKRLEAFTHRTTDQIKSVNESLDSLPEFRDLKDIVTVPIKKDAKTDRAADRAIDEAGWNTLHRFYVLEPKDRIELIMCLQKRKLEIDTKKNSVDQENYDRASSILKYLASSAPMDDVKIELEDVVWAYLQATQLASQKPDGLKNMAITYKNNKDPLLKKYITEAQYEVLQRLNEPQLTALIDGVKAQKAHGDIVADMKRQDLPQTLVAPYDLTKEMFDRLALASLPETFQKPNNVAFILDLLKMRGELEEMYSRGGDILKGLQPSSDGKHNYLLLDITPPANVEEVGEEDGEQWKNKMNRLLAGGSVLMQYVTGETDIVGEDHRETTPLIEVRAPLAWGKDSDPLHPVPTQRRLVQTCAGWKAGGLKILPPLEISQDIQEGLLHMPPTDSISVSPLMSKPAKHAARVTSGKAEGVDTGQAR
jgi:hypothetical protein